MTLCKHCGRQIELLDPYADTYKSRGVVWYHTPGKGILAYLGSGAWSEYCVGVVAEP